MSMTILSIKSRDVLFVGERHGPSSTSAIVAYEASIEKQEPRVVVKLPEHSQDISILESSQQGLVIAGAAGETVYVGALQLDESKDGDSWKCESYMFDASDIICSLDMRVAHDRKSGFKTDLIVGGARGAIYSYPDILSKLSRKSSKNDSLQARKFHWHRRAVHALKWSRDGNYIISGGSENALVLWQLDTGKQNFLPHLSASIENIVVSADGSSYVLHLDDNSTMIISTAELQPTAYIAGIQSVVTNEKPTKDALVSRVWKQLDCAQSPVPFAINPRDTSKLHICVGNGQQASVSGEAPAAPWLQTFDLESFRTVSKHAIARTQPTDVNITSKGYPIVEPRVTHMAFSADGKWLASVDEWEPTSRDVHDMSSRAKDLLKRHRREVYLKFWDVTAASSGGQEQAAPVLASRINAPHTTAHAESVFGLVASHDSAKFASIGGDGMMRVWVPKLRTQDGITFKGVKGQSTYKWVCALAVDLGNNTSSSSKNELQLHGSDAATLTTGSIAFSEDNSTIAVAYGTTDDGSVFMIDAESGAIRRVFHNLWTGTHCCIELMSRYVIVLSDDLRVYDVVADELRYSIDKPALTENSWLKSFQMLAVDRVSGVCAAVIPRQGSQSVIAIFDPEHDNPVCQKLVNRRIVNFTSTANHSGFLALDDAAQVWTVNTVAEQNALRVAQSLDDMHLAVEQAAEQQVQQNTIELLASNDDDNDDDDDDEHMASDNEATAGREGDMDVDMDDDNDYNTHAAVVSREGLAGIFDAASMSTTGSMEELFYRIAGLVAPKTVT